LIRVFPGLSVRDNVRVGGMFGRAPGLLRRTTRNCIAFLP
jgi:hypothetical protein